MSPTRWSKRRDHLVGPEHVLQPAQRVHDVHHARVVAVLGHQVVVPLDLAHRRAHVRLGVQVLELAVLSHLAFGFGVRVGVGVRAGVGVRVAK